MATGAERGVDASEEEERECSLLIYSQFRHDRLRGQIPSVDRLGMTASILWGNCVHARCNGAPSRRQHRRARCKEVLVSPSHVDKRVRAIWRGVDDDVCSIL
ncbi:hypothetical protein EBA01_11175 [Xanthomonas oryzae pv. oryzae]|nr:hypothetical protein EBA01_11175 [Xanthomonas oryzae pv. oryzae]QBN32390.1 hypothetical protein EBA02_12615 [Xanthomonas oryzae pv. oryzae]QBN61275.1 hypothetical protein EBA10_11205 [Xanthomonas oryzae pv. oryzae]QBN64914.1 hypothetical protein EBA11_11135 [Xanthomonas oryzae pv. oryzae]